MLLLWGCVSLARAGPDSSGELRCAEWVALLSTALPGLRCTARGLGWLPGDSTWGRREELERPDPGRRAGLGRAAGRRELELRGEEGSKGVPAKTPAKKGGVGSTGVVEIAGCLNACFGMPLPAH